MSVRMMRSALFLDIINSIISPIPTGYWSVLHAQAYSMRDLRKSMQYTVYKYSTRSLLLNAERGGGGGQPEQFAPGPGFGGGRLPNYYKRA